MSWHTHGFVCQQVWLFLQFCQYPLTHLCWERVWGVFFTFVIFCVPTGEASALNHYLRLKSTESVAIAGDHRSHQTICRDHFQANHHSNQGGPHEPGSPAELVVLSHRLHRGSSQQWADQIEGPSQNQQLKDEQPWRAHEVEAPTWHSSARCYGDSHRHKWVLADVLDVRLSYMVVLLVWVCGCSCRLCGTYQISRRRPVCNRLLQLWKQEPRVSDGSSIGL